jgi:hypothetical protein
MRERNLSWTRSETVWKLAILLAQEVSYKDGLYFHLRVKSLLLLLIDLPVL